MIYGLIFLLSFFLTYIIRIIALKKVLLALPNERSSHLLPTPHGGGIAIAITWFIGLLYLFVFKMIDISLFYSLMVGSVLSFTGFLDDLHDIHPKKRLFIQATVSLVGLYLLGGMSKLEFGFVVIENQWITNILAFLGLMWFINLYNFLDGIDGYAGSEAIFLAVAGWLFFGGDYFLVLIVSVLGFLIWNWHKAKIFMGDVGSTLLGYTIGIFAIYHQNNGISILIWLILFGIFWFDATLTLYRRYQNKEKLSHAHRKHAYQRLVQSGWSHSKVVIYALCVNLILAILGYSALHNQALLMGSFMIACGILYGIIKVVDSRKKFE